MAEVHLTQEPQSIPDLIEESEQVFKKHFGEWNKFKWMNESKDKIPPHLDAGKGLLEAWLKEVDAKAQANVYARAEMPELQTEYRMQALDTAIQYFNSVKTRATDRSKLYNGQANTRCSLEAMNADNYLTTLNNLKKAIALNQEHNIYSSLADVYDNTDIQQGFASALNKTTDDFLKGKIGSSNTSIALENSGKKVPEDSQDTDDVNNSEKSVVVKDSNGTLRHSGENVSEVSEKSVAVTNTNTKSNG